MALAQASAGVCRVVHMLRAFGDELADQAESLQQYDDVMQGTLKRLVP